MNKFQLILRIAECVAKLADTLESGLAKCPVYGMYIFNRFGIVHYKNPFSISFLTDVFLYIMHKIAISSGAITK